MHTVKFCRWRDHRSRRGSVQGSERRDVEDRADDLHRRERYYPCHVGVLAKGFVTDGVRRTVRPLRYRSDEKTGVRSGRADGKRNGSGGYARRGLFAERDRKEVVRLGKHGENASVGGV